MAENINKIRYQYFESEKLAESKEISIDPSLIRDIRQTAAHKDLVLQARKSKQKLVVTYFWVEKENDKVVNELFVTQDTYEVDVIDAWN